MTRDEVWPEVQEILDLLLTVTQRAVERIGFGTAAAFFSRAELPPVPRDKDQKYASDQYLRNPNLQAAHNGLRQRVLENWLSGNPPFGLDQLLFEARLQPGIGADPGSGLLVCHNVLKAFARGGKQIFWQRVSDSGVDPAGHHVVPLTDRQGAALRTYWSGDELKTDGAPLVDPNGQPTNAATPTGNDYTDGVSFYRPALLAPNTSAQVLSWAGRSSIFWLLFAQDEHMRTDDPGDWYHFFLMATLAYYMAAGRVDFTEPAIPVNTSLDRYDAVQYGFSAKLALNFMKGIQNREGVSANIEALDPYRRAWLWANTISFMDGSFYGANEKNDQADVSHECLNHLEGTKFGLAQVPGGPVSPGWRWYIPKPLKMRCAAAPYALPAIPEEMGNLFRIGKGRFTYDATGLSDFIFLYGSLLDPLLAELSQHGPYFDDLKYAPSI